MQTKYSRPLATRTITILLLLIGVAVLSIGTVSFFFKRKSQTDRRQASTFAAEPLATKDSPISNSGLSPAPADENAPASATAQDPPTNQARGSRVIPLRFEDFDQRILLSPREIITVQIETGAADDSLIRIDAPNGGSLNQHKAPALLPALEVARGIRFAVGPTRGLYTLEVNRDGQTRIFEFWVDRESPVGQPGPERTFVH